MDYIVKLINGESVKITEDEQKAFLADRNQFFRFPSNGHVVNKTSVSHIYPNADRDRTEQIIGVLHDGTKAVRKFGLWVDAANPNVKLDVQYYPEVAADCLPTQEEFEREYRQLTPQERLQKMIAGAEERKLLGTKSNFTTIKESA